MLELLDFVSEFFVTNDDDIKVLGTLDDLSFLLSRSFINGDSNSIEVLLDFVPPVVCNRSGTYYEIQRFRLYFRNILTSQVTFIQHNAESLQSLA